MTISVTITKPGVTDQYGRAMTVGTTYAVADDFGLSLIAQLKATDTNSVLTAPGINDAEPMYMQFVNQAAMSNPTPQMLSSYNLTYALQSSPYVNAYSVGNRLVALATTVPPLDTSNSAAAASANTVAIQAALNAGGLVQITQPGTYYCNPFRIPQATTLSLGAGVILKRADSVNAPLIRNKYGGQKNAATRFNRASNIVTVNNRYHGLAVGDLVWVGNLTDTTMNGIQTVATAPDAHTWTYASTGSNGAGGVSTVFGSIIPLRRTLAGSAFSSSSNVVTVSDPGHDLRPGMMVWLGTTGASTSFVGVVEVIAVYADVWQYVTSGSGTGTASGTIAISYDRDIVITGDGTIDGNPLNNATTQDVDLMLSLIVLGGANNSRVDVKRAGGTIFRVVNWFNCNDCLVQDTEFYDTLVGVQWEGGQKRCDTIGIRGGTSKWVSGAQLLDDMVAFSATGVTGASYDSTSSPYGISATKDCRVLRLNAPNCLNGIKLTGYNTATFDNMTFEDISGGMLNNNVTPLSNGTAGIRMVDDTASLTGMVCGRIYIRRVNWYGGANAVMWTTNGTAKLIDIDGVSYNINAQQTSGNTGSACWFYGGSSTSGRINQLRVRNINYSCPESLSGAKPAIALGSGNTKASNTFTLDDFELDGYTITVGSSFSSGAGVLKYGNCTMTQARIGRGVFYGPASGTGHAIACIGPDNMGRWILDGMRVAAGSASMSFVMTVGNSDQTVCAGEIVLNNCDINSISGIYDNNSAWSGTLTVRANNSKMVYSGNLFNMNAATGLIALHAAQNVTTTADKVIGTVAGGATLRVNGPSIQLVGSKVTAPQPGDMFWSTDTSTSGSASIGMKARTNAGAWTALF